MRTLRIAKGLKLTDMKQEFTVGENTWSQYENDKRVPDMEMLKKIALFFSVSIDYLFGVTEEKYDPKDIEFKELLKIFCVLSQEEKKALLVLVKKALNKTEGD